MKEFLGEMVEEEDSDLLVPMIDEYEKLYKQAEGMVEGTLTTPFALSEKQQQAMSKVLSEKEFPGKTLTVNLEVDPGMSDGFTFLGGGRSLDKTWSTYADGFMALINDAE